MSLADVIPPRFRKLERESDIELYLSIRVRKEDYESIFPWYIIMFRELLEKELRQVEPNCKVSLAQGLSSFFAVLITPDGVYTTSFSTLEEDEGIPTERKVTPVERGRKNGGGEKKMRVVIEGAALEKIGAQMGDRLNLYVVESTPEREGYLRLVSARKLR